MSQPLPTWQEEDFGPYRLHERLGVGGMATVYRAIHRVSGERVALKRLLPQLAGDAMLIRQFRREAAIARALAHPNMAYVHDFGEVDGVYYLTMEEIDGPSVLELLRLANEGAQPAPIGVSLWILREILCALDYAMTGLDEDGEPFNIVHRDLSPSNVIINRRGEVKIIDFGVAKSLVGRYATNSGRIKGKLGYMSPEALAGRKIDSRSDLYSLAVLAWELLTARRLFRGSEREQMALRAKNHERTPPSTHNPEVPRELDEIIATTLAEDPDMRWATAGDMLKALDPLLTSHGQGASPRALREWMNGLLFDVDDGQVQELHRDSRMPAETSGIGQSGITMLTSKLNVPGVRRFRDEVKTVVDPIFDARARHSEAQVDLAAGSNRFSVPTQEALRESEPASDRATDIVEPRDPDTLDIGELVAAYVQD